MSFRLKLLLAWAAAGLVIIAMLVWTASALTERFLLEQLKVRVEETKPLLNAALAAPLAQRDYATVQQILTEARAHRGISCRPRQRVQECRRHCAVEAVQHRRAIQRDDQYAVAQLAQDQIGFHWGTAWSRISG